MTKTTPWMHEPTPRRFAPSGEVRSTRSLDAAIPRAEGGAGENDQRQPSPVSSGRALHGRGDHGPQQKVAAAITTKPVAEQEALAATDKATAQQNEALGVIEEARGQAEANRLRAERLRMRGAPEVAVLETFRL